MGYRSLKTLFSKFKHNEDIGGSPYLLPIAVKKLPTEDLFCIRDIGEPRYMSEASLGYVRATVENLSRMSSQQINEVINWRFRDNCDDPENELAVRLADKITLEHIRDLNDRYALTWEKDILAAMAPRLSEDVLHYLVEEVDFGIPFIQYLPKRERIPLLKNLLEHNQRLPFIEQLNKFSQGLKKELHGLKRIRFNRVSRREMISSGLKGGVPERYGLGFLLTAPFVSVLSLSFGVNEFGLKLLQSLKSQYQVMVCTLNIGKLLRHQRTANEKYLRDSLSKPKSRFALLIKSFAFKIMLGIYDILSWPLFTRLLLAFSFLFTLLISVIALLIILVMLVLSICLAVVFTPVFLIYSLFVYLKDYLSERNSRVEQDKWEKLRDQVSQINQLSSAAERRQAFNRALSSLQYPLFHNPFRNPIAPDYITYAQKSQYIWSELDPEFVEDFLGLDIDLSYWHGPDDYVRAVIPVVAILRKDLLPELEKMIKRVFTLEAELYAKLSLFLEDKKKIEVLEKSGQALKKALPQDEPTILYTLDIMADASVDLTLKWLRIYPEIDIFAKLAPKVVREEEHLIKTFNIAQRLNSSIHKFVCAIAPGLGYEWLAKFILLIADRGDKKEQLNSYPCLCARWVQLPKQEAYEVWCEVTHGMAKYPREKMLDQLSYFTEVIAYLGGEQAVMQVGETVFEVSHWWSD